MRAVSPSKKEANTEKIRENLIQIENTEPWEKKFGESIQERTQNLGHGSNEYRESVKFPPPDKESKLMHEVYIHHLGSEMLRAMFTDDQLYERERAIALKKQSKIGQLLRKRIKVTDFDDGGLNISMEQDWDTSSWNDTLVESAAEALVYIFYDLNGVSSIERKERAIQMLKKLMDRHTAAVDYIKKNLEMLMGKAASKLIRNGVSGGILNLLYVINSCKEQFSFELSNYNFAGRIVDMLIIEAKLAAILIQHTYRARYSKRKLKEQQTHVAFSHLKGFGTEKEVYYRRLRVINARSSELRYYWRLMHEQHPASTRQLTGGMRGPIHVGPTYLVLCLDIIRFLVSDNLKAFAHPNREDVVRAKGCILLSTYIGTMNNKFASYAVQVLAEIAKVAESLYHIIESGCIDSVVKYLRYLRTILGVGVKVVKAKSQDTLSPTIAYLSSLDIIGNAALHAAGVFRARDNYQCVRSAAKGVERTDYRQVLSTMKIRNGRTIDDLTPLLCSHRILKELSIIIQTSQQLSITSKACYCYLIILSCDGHHRALDEVTAGGAKLLLKIMSFLTHDDDSLATTALCIFQQLTCYESSRHAMSIINLPGHLLPLFDQITTATPSLKSQGNNASTQSQKKLYRLLLVMIFLARQKNWRLYDPELLYEELLQSDLNHLREIMYVYLLRIIKDQCFLGNNQDITRSDLLLLPSYALLSRAMGKVLINYPFHFLLNCLYHPENPIYYEACPLDETCTVCVILQSLVFYKPILTHVYSSKLVLYLSKFLFLCKYLFLGKSMTNRQIVLLFQGIKSAIIFLSEMIPVILYDEEAIVSLLAVVKETELIDQSILFFLNTLQEFQIQKKLQEEEINSDNQRTQLYYTLQLQKEIGVCSIKFLTNYSKLVNHWHLRPLPVRYLPDSTRVSVSIQDLYPPAIRVVKTLRNLKNLYQDANKESGTLSARRASRELGSSLKEEFDFHNITGTLTSFYSNKNITFQFNSYRDEMAFIQDCLCSCLAEMTRTKGGAVAALQEWDVQNALRHHLPPPLSGLVFSNKTNQIPDPTTTLHIKPQQTAPAILTSALKSSTNDMNIISTGKKVTISSDTNLYPRPGSAQLTPNSNTSDNLLFSPLGKGLTINTDFSAMTPHRNKEYGSSIKSPHHAHNTAHPMKRTLTEVILQDESHANYRLQLMEIPSSFFELIAHLCFIEEGKIFCFADGFVRHALDKLTLIHTLLPTNQTNEVIVHYQQYQNQQRQQSKRLIMSASSSVSGSRSSSFLLSSAVKSPKNRLRSPQGTIASTPSSILSNSVPGSFDAEEARRGLKRAESMMSEGKDDDDYYRHIVDFAKHFRASFDQTQPAFHPQSAFTPSAVPRRGTNVTPGINVIHASNVMNTTLTPDEVFNWIHRKNDIIACLKIIKSIANFHHKHHGSANDIILSTSLYAIAAICKDLIKLHLPREDEVILLAYECLSELAKDTFRFHNPMEENHLLELARQEMSLSIDFPVRGLIAVVNMIRYACQGITSHYIVSMIPLLREPLLRVSRIFPQLSDDIRSANWMLTKSAMIFKSTVDPNYIVSNVQNITVEMEEFFRTGHLHKQTEMQVHPNAEINSRLENNHEDRNSALPISSEIKLPSTKHHHTSAGDYTYCGVESCGSLRFPDAPHNHGEYHHLSEDKRKEILQKLPLLEESLLSSPNQSERAQQYLMPLTKMTAQGKVLRDTLQIAKAKNGFTEIRAVKMNSDKRFTHKVYEDQNNSQGLTSQIRSISVTELPELKLTRPKMPK